jgi:hypothetical protein
MLLKLSSVVKNGDDGYMKKKSTETANAVTLPCGCVYQDKGWMLTRINECDYHKRKRTAKRPHKPKAECVRP